ncbi:E3 ubiquitin-protein ligase HUWE1-like [Schistocerca cancellata]|uniref:E3 ubiquitin-protein ligase HUWE1-like n=1 Tax=Schistocerca cancellata TaxID=274614 RepID=UPI00211947BB|nr:E3 ubiquitin-protein ligase HUWE1-like [Schistocerca cancellata]
MKIDKGRLKKSSSEVPPDCQALIDKLRTSNRKDLFYVLKGIETWNFGKCELYHWIDVLDVLDDILEESAKRESARSWILRIDLPEMEWERQLLLRVLNFTTLLIEHSFSRHLYNSVEHLISLLTSCNMSVVLAVLNLLYMFSKRSNFITRLSADKKKSLLARLNRLAESWCAYDEGVSLAQSCRNMYLGGRSTLHYEFYEPPKGHQKGSLLSKSAIHIDNIECLGLSAAALMDNIMKRHPTLTEEKQLLLFSRLRLYINFPSYDTRLLCVQARLQATSVLAYTNAILENAHTLLYNGFLEELVEVVQLSDPNLTDIRAAALRTLTSITHLDRHPHFTKKPSARLNMIIEVTTANSFHGFLPTFVRSCVSTLLSDPQLNRPKCPFPLPLATALFSFLYHLASYDAGGEALVSSGMMECLLRVIHWHGRELEHITFVTRAVRVIDLITNIDMQSFQAHGGLSSFISRLEDPRNSLWRGNVRAEVPQPSSARQGGSSSSDEEDEDDASTLSHAQQEDGAVGERMNVPLVDYIINVMKFLDSILTNNSTDDHCREFISQGGIPRLMKILEISYLPLDHPVTSAGQAVATVCKSILNLTHEGEIFRVGLENMETILSRMTELQLATINANGSILLHELAIQANAEVAFNSVHSLPLLHGVNSIHGYVVMFLNLSRSSQNELRSLALAHWGSVRGLCVLSLLKSLYKALVWESTVLLALCSDEVPLDKDFAKEDLQKLMPQDKGVGERSSGSDKGMTTAMEALSTNDTDASHESGTEQRNFLKVPPNIVAKYIKPLLHASSRLGRALAELFGMLVKLSVGTPLKRRQRYTVLSRVLTPAAKDISESLAMLLVDCLSWTSLPKVCVPQFKLTYLICSVGFTSPLLFDEKKNPYYLMLYQFLRYGGHTAYFESFRKALTDNDKLPIKTAFENPLLPEGTGEFLDAWLLLLEKMVNTKCILDSPYSHIYKGPADEGFDPAKFLFEVQKCATHKASLSPLLIHSSPGNEFLLKLHVVVFRPQQHEVPVEIRSQGCCGSAMVTKKPYGWHTVGRLQELAERISTETS